MRVKVEDEKRRKRDNGESGGGKDRVKMRKRVGNSRKKERAVTEGRGAVSYGGKLRESVGENVMGSSVN